MTPGPADPQAPLEPPDEIFTPTNGWPIRKLYAFLSVDEGGEGICAMQLRDHTMMPMIVSSTKTLERLKQDARRLSRITGKRIVLAEFKRNGKELWTTDGKDA